MKWALLEVTLGIACILGWASLMTFSVLRLTGVLEVETGTASAVTLALLPFALGFPLGADMIEKGMGELAPGLITLIGVALIWVTAFPILDRITDWVAGATDQLIEKGTKP